MTDDQIAAYQYGGVRELVELSWDELLEQFEKLLDEDEHDRKLRRALADGCGRGIEMDVLPDLHGSARPPEKR